MDSHAERVQRIKKGHDRLLAAVMNLPSTKDQKMGRSTYRRIHEARHFWIIAEAKPFSDFTNKNLDMREREVIAIERLPKVYPWIERNFPAAVHYNKRDAWKKPLKSGV